MSSILSKLINLAGNITGTLKVTNGGTGVTSSTGTVAVVLSTSPTLVTPLLGTPTSGNLANCTAYPNVTQSVAGLVSSAGQLLGTNTNDAASSGNVGQTITISRLRSNATSLTSGSSVNVGTTTSITLTAGDWMVYGAVGFTTNGTASVTAYDLSSSQTSATASGADTLAVPTNGEVRVIIQQATEIPNGDDVFVLPKQRVSVANGNTLVLYLVAKSSFTGVAAAVSVYGSMEARRFR